MKKTKIILMVMLLALMICGLNADNGDDSRDLFEKAKSKLFDRNWSTALTFLNEYIERYPDEEFYKKSLFYRGKCFEELKKYNRALESYEKYSRISDNENLFEEATIAIIDISFKLSKNQKKKYLLKISGYLNNSVKTIRYYAAFKLSYTEDKKYADKGVSVLKNILKMEEDKELVDRAKLALMRINPKYLKSDNRRKHIGNKDLHIVIFDKKRNKETFSLNIPFLLAKLALEALPSEEKKIMKDKGYSIDSVLDEIINSGELFKIEVEDIIIKIWIE